MHYYDMNGRPMAMEEWAQAFDDPNRIIASTELPGGCLVSTVWLGLDHSYGSGPPLIFESMVFGPDNHVDLDCERYTTREQAEAGHSALVTRWTGWTPGDPYPEGRVASILTQFLEALNSERIEAPGDEPNPEDAMVVMYPKEIAERMEMTPTQEE